MEISIPCTRVYLNTGDPIEEKNLVEFRLLYEGPLRGQEAGAADKHAIRQALHPQLRQLWKVKEYLKWVAHDFASSPKTNPKDKQPEEGEDRFSFGIRLMGENWAKGTGEDAFHFVPVVTEGLALRCSLDILLLRPGEKKYIVEQGDIDNQIKTLFDGLKIPTRLADIGGVPCQDDEHPFFCLLEDDRLVSEIRVNGDELLMLPDERVAIQQRDEARATLNLMLYDQDGKFNLGTRERAALEFAREFMTRRTEVRAIDAFAVIHVRLNHKDPRTFGNYLGSD